MDFFSNYFKPELMEGRVMWIISTFFVWFWMVRYRERAIKGLENSNLFWEGHEQVIYWALMSMPPILFKAAFISDVPVAVWYFEGGLVGFALFGRSILDYGLAFLGRTPVNPSELDTKTTTTTTTETK